MIVAIELLEKKLIDKIGHLFAKVSMNFMIGAPSVGIAVTWSSQC